MQVGVVFPQTELPPDRGAVRAYVQAVAALGYRHVLGADPAVHPGRDPSYAVDNWPRRSSSCRSARLLWWPSRRRRWTC